jgi:acyl-CoA synthetase (NDP forming)
VVLLYVESFGNPRRFGRLAQRVARRKPILALKSGTSASGQRAASSHTAALAGSEAGVDALFDQAGVIRAASLEELIDVATLLSSQPEPRGRRLAVVTNAGGLGILAADACDVAGLELPQLAEETEAGLRTLLPVEASLANPVDMLGSATAATYEQVIPVVLADPQVDALLALFVPAVTATAADVAAAVDAAARAADAEKPVLAVVMSSAGVPQALRAGSAAAAFAYPESAVRALGRVAERAAWLRRPLGVLPRLDGIDRAAAANVVERALQRSEDSWLDPAETRELLAAYGLPLVPERIAVDGDAATRAAEELGFPAVVKSAAPGAHKTETGGVALDLEDAAAVRAAAERIGFPVVVQPMLRAGTELLAGLVQDPVFGPLVAFGPGGVLAELIGEATLRMAPLTDIDAEELVMSGKAGRLVRGFRGAAAADAAALVDLVLRLGSLGDDLPAVAELDLNPVLAFPDRAIAVDARICVSRPQRAATREELVAAP